jgi:hypothetical protein
MILENKFLIPILNHEIRSGETEFKVYEGWRTDNPIFKGIYSSGKMSVTSIRKSDYCRNFPDHREFPNYYDLIQKVLHASCIFKKDEVLLFKEKFDSIVGDEEPYKRNVRFYYDTNSLMNNYFFNFRELIPGFVKKAGHTISYGVMSELENHFDKKLKNQFFPDEFDEFYGDDRYMFFNQPNLVGRFARLAYPEADLMKNKFGSNIINVYKTGDTEILNSFISDCNDNNLEGIMVTNDSTMAERASKRMGSWHVRFDFREIKDLEVNIEYFLEAIYRASIIYGRVKINDEIIIDGIWKGKKDDWKKNSLRVVRCRDCGMKRIKNILEEVPPDFYGKGYYGD